MNTEFLRNDMSRDAVSVVEEEVGPFVEIDGQSFYKIGDVDEMATFLINLVSSSDHWMFIASNGGLTAGRKDADNALFPYYTQDKLFELADTVGSLSLFWVNTNNGHSFWNPFSNDDDSSDTTINLFKNIEGSELIFEAVNEVLGLRFRYKWAFSERHGFVRKASIRNTGTSTAKIRLLDGIQNIVPYGLDQVFVNQFSNLADAYKKNELVLEEMLGIYYLSSIPTDRAEPSEGLRASVAWASGLEDSKVLLSNRQVERFRANEEIVQEGETRGTRGSFLLESRIELFSGEELDWWIVADINYDAAQVEELRDEISKEALLGVRLDLEVQENTNDLRRRVASSDGLQLSADPLRDARHQSNALFNIMRGGVFDNEYHISVTDFLKYLKACNREIFERHASELGEGSAKMERSGLLDWAAKSGNSDLHRLACEYLPLTFSRRHGDPSRPWNKFSIETRDAEGNPILNYQGNWRDIFQNWEALSYSFPEYLDGMIMRFLNTSTIDGYNPYRITRDGFDWEVLDPDESWSNIGYWGDHQIVYLLKLLEASEKFYPGRLSKWLNENIFVYADVPYRIRSFEDIWRDPRNTVKYDEIEAALSESRREKIGSDGNLLHKDGGELIKANLMEKLLCPLLSKLSNFVPDGGIWMNTQRPEWNDANNALVGYGVSVVTLCYVNRYLEFLIGFLEEKTGISLVDTDTNEFIESLRETFEKFENREFDETSRFEMMAKLGHSGEVYRNAAYSRSGSREKQSIEIQSIVRFLELAKRFVSKSIDANRRSDGLYHSYNLLEPTSDQSVEIDHLSEMLEGQVAVLSSRRLSAEEACGLMNALRSSSLYRDDVGTYMLYPDRDLPSFLEKNVVESSAVDSSSVLRKMIDEKDERIIKEDKKGLYRFNGDFRNSEDLEEALGRVASDYAGECGDDGAIQIKKIFEECFDHRRFTGRSSTFFAYEGLGSIYWHMVSKLVLAVQENCFHADRSGIGANTCEALANHYFETLEGLGLGKTPQEYGAFPTDAYSHTPKQSGVQQPGMTGQVKEDLLTRVSELGLVVENGRIEFKPILLRKCEFLKNPDTIRYYGKSSMQQSAEVDVGELAFTFCQTLFVLRLGEFEELVVHYSGGANESLSGLRLGVDWSRLIFDRDSSVERVDVVICEDTLGE